MMDLKYVGQDLRESTRNRNKRGKIKEKKTKGIQKQFKVD